ncbi:hypothetical protein PHYBOEH_007755 [Phytophthora boehmeriae]|uniref:RxLR effector protein n=1 Tax=Phytophthora boehmeriae TaxID=109152 RepID=A0A8T1W602_9STRA|nr:hypothetical protein PHYBOEH_007755 [Phytophthora boehmeriae]
MHIMWMLMAAFAACCIATSSATTPNMIKLGDSLSHEITGNILLQSDKNKDRDDAATDGEERLVSKLRGALGLYSPKLKTSTFDKMIADDMFKAEMFEKWDKLDVSIKKIKKSINPVKNTQFERIYNEYAVRRLLKTLKYTPDRLMRELKASFPYRYADEATKKETEETMIKYIGAALRSIQNKP